MSFSGSRTRRKRPAQSGGLREGAHSQPGRRGAPVLAAGDADPHQARRGPAVVAALGDEPPDPALLGLPQRTTRSRSRMLLKLQQPQRIEGAAGLRRARACGTETLCHLAYHLVTGTLNLGWASLFLAFLRRTLVFHDDDPRPSFRNN